MVGLTMYCLRCTVCKGEFGSKSEWHRHLTQEQHQKKARVECLEKWAVSKVKKKSCLVIYSSFPLTRGGGDADKVIRHFSSDPGTFVTDFVFWEERPYLAILQLESRVKVDAVLNGKNRLDVRVNGQRIQVKCASKLLQLEWQAIFQREVTKESPKSTEQPQEVPQRGKRPLNPDNSQNEVSSAKKVKLDPNFVPSFKRRTAIVDLQTYLESQGSEWEYKYRSKVKNRRRRKPVTVWSCNVTVNGVEYQVPEEHKKWRRTKMVAKRQIAVFCLQALYRNHYSEKSLPVEPSLATEKAPINKDTPWCPVPLEPCPVPLASTTCLPYQFWEVRKAVSIPDQEYRQALKIQAQLRHLLRTTNKMAELTVESFRNWHMKLRNVHWPDTSELLLYVCTFTTATRRTRQATLTWTGVSDRMVQRAIQKCDTFSAAPLESSSNPNITDGNKVAERYLHHGTNVSFTLVTFPRYLAEVQLCRLLEYMCRFDARCCPLLTLAFYWCQLNEITLGTPSGSNLCLPEPHTLEWLVMFWFSHKELIPTVRQIQSRPHNKKLERNTDTDVGFTEDLRFVEEWKNDRKEENPTLPLEEDYTSEEFLLNVLCLFQEFLEFYGNLRNTSSILNTRDGEVVNSNEFACTTDPGKWASPRAWSKGMTRAELVTLRFIQSKTPEQQKLFSTSGMERETPAQYQDYNFRTHFPNWTLYIVHPFIFNRRFSLAKQVNQLEAMSRSAGKLNEFLQLRKRPEDGVKMAKKRFGTLESVLKVDE